MSLPRLLSRNHQGVARLGSMNMNLLLRFLSSEKSSKAEVGTPASLARSMINSTIHKHPLVVFMKGTLESPRCGFSRSVIEVLQREGLGNAQIHSVNVLEDENIRREIKNYSYFNDLIRFYYLCV